MPWPSWDRVQTWTAVFDRSAVSPLCFDRFLSPGMSKVFGTQRQASRLAPISNDENLGRGGPSRVQVGQFSPFYFPPEEEKRPHFPNHSRPGCRPTHCPKPSPIQSSDPGLRSSISPSPSNHPSPEPSPSPSASESASPSPSPSLGANSSPSPAPGVGSVVHRSRCLCPRFSPQVSLAFVSRSCIGSHPGRGFIKDSWQ